MPTLDLAAMAWTRSSHTHGSTVLIGTTCAKRLRHTSQRRAHRCDHFCTRSQPANSAPLAWGSCCSKSPPTSTISKMTEEGGEEQSTQPERTRTISQK